MLNVSYHIAQYTSIIADLRSEIQRLKKKITEQSGHQSSADRTDIRHVQGTSPKHLEMVYFTELFDPSLLFSSAVEIIYGDFFFIT